jgi:crossover junction endonuclease EME1
MPEVINLCLDDSPLPIRRSPRPPVRARANRPAQVFLLSDDTDPDIQIDLPVPKRIRLTPSPVSGETWQWSEGLREDTGGSREGTRSRAAGARITSTTRTTRTSREKQASTGASPLDDPIIFTSSPQWASVAARKPRSYQKFSSDDDLEDIEALVQRDPRPVNAQPNPVETASMLSDKTASILAGLKQKSKLVVKSKARDGRNTRDAAESIRSGGLEDHEADSLSDISTRKARNKPAKPRLTEAERDAAKALKQAEKDRVKAAKAEEKAVKTRQKKHEAEITEVNKRKSNKKDSTPEMIVDLPRSMEGSTLGTQTCQFLENVGVQVAYWNCSSQDLIIKWRRKIVSAYNEDHGYREPVAETIQDEKRILLILPAKDFVSLAAAEPPSMDETLDSYIQKFKTRYSTNTPLIIIEGLQFWKNKNKTLENRAFRNGVLSQLPEQSSNIPSSQSRARKNKKPTENHNHVPEDIVEEALLRLQILHSVLIHHTTHPLETAEWVTNFTQHISTIPYKLEKQRLDTAFCMETGQVTVGKDKTDTYIRMLQEIVRVTPPVAMGIQRQYNTVGELTRGLRDNGPLALEDVEKTAHGNSNVTGGRIGPALSKRIWKIFTGLDPSSSDGIV